MGLHVPEWLMAVLAATAISIAGNYVSHLISMRVTMVALAEHARRLQIVEEKKLDSRVHEIETKHFDELVKIYAHDVSNVKHRMDIVDERLTAEIIRGNSAA